MLWGKQELKKLSYADDGSLSKRDAKNMRNSGSYLGVTDNVNTRWAKETMLAEASTTGFGASLFLSVGRIGEGHTLVGDYLDGLIPHETVVYIYESLQVLVACFCVVVVIDWQFRTLIINRLNNLDEAVAYAQRMPQESFFAYNLFFVRWTPRHVSSVYAYASQAFKEKRVFKEKTVRVCSSISAFFRHSKVRVCSSISL